MDNSRRDFFKKLGLLGLAAAATSIPTELVASMVDKGIDHGQKIILDKKIDVWCFIQRSNVESKCYMTPNEAMIAELIWRSGSSNPIESINNIAYKTNQLNQEIKFTTFKKSITLEEYLNDHLYGYEKNLDNSK